MNALELHNVTKRFGEKVIANDHVSLTVRRGEILAVLGENGSGKTTLMNMIAGIYHPDEGEIYVNGQPVTISSPRDAFRCGIGMVHQHFKLVDVFTATENIVLGVEDGKPYRLKEATRRVEEDLRPLWLRDRRQRRPTPCLFPKSRPSRSSRCCIAVRRSVILDEPTAVLTPQETEKLFAVLRRMREDGKSIVIITHKLNEVLSLSDRVTVLHKGKNAGTVNTAETNEAQLTEMMVGQKVVLNIERKMPENPEDRLVVKDVSCLSRDGVQLLDRVTFTARAGEILGIAGIAGSGQRELLEAIAGLQPVTGGEILYEDPKSGETENLRDKTPLQIRELGVRLSFVPEDRLGMGLVSNMDIIDNMMLRSYRRGRSAFLDRQPPRELAERIIEDLGVVTPNATTPVRRLSGGNVQKVLVGREIASAPTVLMAAYPVRGLDINSSYLIYHLLNQQKEKGVAVIYVGEDLDVLLALCDRVIVLSGGRVTGTVDGRTATKEEIGLLMTKAEREGESHVKAE